MSIAVQIRKLPVHKLRMWTEVVNVMWGYVFFVIVCAVIAFAATTLTV